MVMRIYALLLALACACSFNERDFGDRLCTGDQDCPRPDQACIQNTCTQKACTAEATCGAGYDFDCASGLCVVRTCSGGVGCELGYVCEDGFCAATFNVTSAAATTNRSITVTFDSPPDPVSAIVLANYAIDGLSSNGTPTLSGSTVTLATSSQTETSYNVTVSNVTRELDNAPLRTATSQFTGRNAFGVISAISASNTSLRIMFDAPPDPATATALSSYSVPNLTLSGTPVISGNAVTIATSPQAQLQYTVTVTGVRRATDLEPLATNLANFTGRIDFNVIRAQAMRSNTIEVEFDAPPNVAQATTLSNYALSGGLTPSGTPSLSGNIVTLTTTPQAAQSYTVTVSNVRRANDSEALTVTGASFAGILPFNVLSAAVVNSARITVTFDAAPDPIEAVRLENYSVPGLTLGGTPTLLGNTVTLETSAQSATSYTIVVSTVERATDTEPLTTAMASFTGRTPFHVIGAAATTSQTVTVTFDAAPNAAQATTLGNYMISGLTVTGATLSGNVVTLTTSPQSSTSFNVSVTGVTRAADSEPLSTTAASFTGRAPFNVISAVSNSSTSMTLVFDAAPNAGQATNLGNYVIGGLALTGVPALAGNAVTLTTSPQAAQTYAVSVSNVRRQSDAEGLTVPGATFAGRAPFNVVSAASTSNTSMTVTFDAPPTVAEATNLANYSVGGLGLGGTATLSGNTVTITTASQVVQSYTVTVSNVTRASDGELMTNTSASFTGRTGFNVVGAASVNNTTMSITFDAAPTMAQAITLSNYATAPSLTLSNPSLSGNTVTFTTSAQAATTYSVTVANVTRASDLSPLSVSSATFVHVSFNVLSAVSTSSKSVAVTFDAPPNATQAGTAANFVITGSGGVTVMAATLVGNTVNLMTSTQVAATYTVTVNNVTRASDGTVLTAKTALFAGRTAFSVASGDSPNSGTITVTFTDPPNAAQATTLANYNIPNLVLRGTPVLSGSTVTIDTAAQVMTSYTVTVANVTRQSDAEPLTTVTSTFVGKSVVTPTVTNVGVLSTVPNNSTTFFNTGTATVQVIGTEFSGVTCGNIKLDDLDGSGNLVNTAATSCTVESYSQLTATFPRGIRTNGTLGWNVRITNSAGTSTNTASSGKLIVEAGLLISEVLVGLGGGNGEHEFFEIWNATNTTLNLSDLGLAVHIRNGGTDTNLTLTHVKAPAERDVIAHGFYLFASSSSPSSTSWFAKIDATYNHVIAQLGGDASVYLSLSAAAQGKVIDKVGWGAQPSPQGREGSTAMANPGNNVSIQRKPAGGNGHATDDDANAADFTAPSSTLSPRGSNDPAEN